MTHFSKLYRIFLTLTFFVTCWLGMSERATAQFTVTRTCLTECTDTVGATRFKDITPIAATKWAWNFGDGGSGTKNTSSLQNPTHLYTTAGTKTVTLIRTEAGLPKTYTQTITINDVPRSFYLGNAPEQTDTTLCKSDFITLDPYKNGGSPPQYTYLWYPRGDTLQALNIRVDSTQCFSVLVKDTLTGCTYENKLTVKPCPPPPPKPANEYWYFGTNAGIKFTDGSATVDDKGKLTSREGVATVNDPNGNMLFYTDGTTVYYKDGSVMKSANPSTGSGGSANATQSVIIVPKPSCQGCQSEYYIFTTTDINGQQQLSYSLVDIRQNGGKGKVVEKNVLLNESTSNTESLASVFVEKDSTYWVVSHDYGNNSFRMYKVTKNGISVDKTVKIGLTIDSLKKGEGTLKFSSDGKKLAYIIPGGARNYVQLYDFDPEKGTITNEKTIDLGATPPKAYGVEFSPNGNGLYVTLKADTLKTATDYSKLLYFDLTPTDADGISKSRVTIDSTNQRAWGAIQLAPDGKIYMAIQGLDSLAVIGKPDVSLAKTAISTWVGKNVKQDSIAYERNGFSLNGKLSQLGLPVSGAKVTAQSDGVGVSVADTCFGSPTNFQTNHLCGDKLKNFKTNWAFYQGDVPANGQPSGSLVASIQGGDGDKGLKVSYTFPSAGKYYVIVTMGNRCKPDTALPPQAFEVKPVPTPTLGADLSLCADKTNLTTINPLDKSTYTWYKDGVVIASQNQRIITVTESGTYKVQVDRLGCIGTATQKIVLGKAKALNLPNDTTLCSGQSILLDATSAGDATSTFLWSTGSTASNITVATSGTYSVTVKTTLTGGVICTTTDQIVVKVNSKMVYTTALTRPSACKGNDGIITINPTSPITTYTYKWYKNGVAIVGATSNKQTGLGVGDYQIIAKSGQTCDETINLTLTILATPQATFNLTKTDVTCVKDGAINFSLVQNPPNPVFTPANYILRTSASPSTIVRTGTIASIFISSNNYRIASLATGTYIIDITNVEGCQLSSNELTLDAIPRNIINFFTTPANLCEGTLITLSPSLPTGSIIWNTGESTPSIKVIKAGTYDVTVVSNDGKCIDSKSTTVIYRPTPNLDIEPTFEFCQNNISPIGVQTETGVSYRWNTGATTATILPERSGTYKVSATNGNCSVDTVIKVTIINSPTINLKPETTICLADLSPAFVTLSPIVSGNTQGYKWLWMPDNKQTQSINISVIGTYSVVATNGAGCSSVATTRLTDYCRPSIVVPTIFTPNNDGVNDKLEIFTQYILPTNFQFMVYNRWGEVVFATKDKTDFWDGKINGILAQPNSYAWIMSYKPEYPDNSSSIKVIKGAVTVSW